ncbi:60S ribosomal protein L7 [Trypanosoma theileri]|uniref:60S ribosomal protein L7 n=1 Tax=Trypanosoma theileri TaxID=67003 RepID=A0A1X0P864_9TRYP|nr:60S ribosomal protein L7 [Trypanosoma theileri]ORC92610.1 60S ribosomal protein L7 [Trypanosoma theileri]
MGKNPPKWLPGDRVKETILLQRKSVEQLRADRVLRRDKLQERRDRHKAKLDAKRKRKLTKKKFISAQTILKHAQRAQRQGHVFRKIGERVRGKRFRLVQQQLQEEKEQINAKEGETAEEETTTKTEEKAPVVVLVVRAKGRQIPTEVAAAFRRLGLQKLYAARLICLDDPNRPHLNNKNRHSNQTEVLVRQLAPFAIVGRPPAAQLEELLRTRGCLWNAETRTRRIISGNLMLEQTLGQYNVLCVEDLCDAIVKGSEHVQEILQHIAPFDFHPPRQLFMERHRSVHQKLEVVNRDSFASYLAQQLKTATRKEKKLEASNKRKAAKKASLAS